MMIHFLKNHPQYLVILLIFLVNYQITAFEVVKKHYLIGLGCPCGNMNSIFGMV
jgi:hypothetical protein